VHFLRCNNDGVLSRGLGFGNDFSFLLFVGFLFLLLRVDSNLDGDLASADLLALKGFDCFLLFGFVANIDKAKAFAAPGLTESAVNNARRYNFDAGISEELSEASVVDIEAEISDKEHSLGRFACGSFTGRTGWTGCPFLTWGRLGRLALNGTLGGGSSVGRCLRLLL
jgi:hypothetical protein